MGKDKSSTHATCFLRVNYLYQAAHAALRVNPRNLQLTRFYVHTLRTIVKKNVLRLEPALKRTLCKKCFMLLVPGITSSVRVQSRRQRHLVIKCLECGTLKRLVLDPEHRLWFDHKEAWLGIVPSHILTNIENQLKNHTVNTPVPQPEVGNGPISRKDTLDHMTPSSSATSDNNLQNVADPKPDKEAASNATDGQLPKISDKDHCAMKSSLELDCSVVKTSDCLAAVHTVHVESDAVMRNGAFLESKNSCNS